MRMTVKRLPKSAVVLAALLLALSAHPGRAAGGREASPAWIELPLLPRQYIAPANPDSAQRTLRLPFPSAAVPASDAGITEYSLSVFDSGGAEVFRQQEVEPNRRGFFGRLFGAGTPHLEIPGELIWDGTFFGSSLGADGSYVPDGDYTYQLTIIDESGRVARTPPFAVTVDNSAPVIEYVEMPGYLVFSPDGDGVRDTVTVNQSGSRELRWTGRILDRHGAPLFEEQWQNENPADRSRDVSPAEQFIWDGSVRFSGHPLDGTTAPEDEYAYELAGYDRAGNRTSVISDWLISLDMRSGDIGLRATHPAFSPDGDGVQDQLTFEATVIETDGVASWSLTITAERQPETVLRRFSDGRIVPRRIVFDGVDSQARRLADGSYRALFEVEYENGTVTRAPVVIFGIDSAAPQATIVPNTFPQTTDPGEPLVFGGSEKRGVELRVRMEAGLDWQATLETPFGRRVMPLFDFGFAESEFVYRWDGSDPATGEVPDGFYSFVIEAMDAAGNRGSSNVVRVRKDTREAAVDIRLEGSTVLLGRPDGGVPIVPQFSIADGVDQFRLDIRDERGRVVRSSHQRVPFERFIWLGENNAGEQVPEGHYTVDFQVIYINGNKPRISGVGPIFVDRFSAMVPETPPAVSISVSPLPFSPDSDGVNDLLRMRMEAQSLLALDRWTLDIIDPRDNPFIAFGGHGEPDRYVIWNGLSAAGELVQSAEDYTAVLRVRDVRGNLSEARAVIPVDILVMRDGERLRIRIPSIQYAPNTADLFDVEREDLERNLTTLRRLAQILDRYPDRRILIEGHAAHVHWQESTVRERSQRAEEELTRLTPLSRARAEEVRQVLIILGIDRDRMRIEGVGGRRPVVPHSDRENVWKNRRVEFVLER